MKKLLTGALASVALAATLFTASAPLVSTGAEARRCTMSDPCTRGRTGGYRRDRGGSSGIDLTTLMLLGGGGLASPMGFAGSAATGGFSAIIPFLLLEQLDDGGRRGRRGRR